MQPLAPTPSTIDPDEAAHFGAMAAEWWDPKGSSAMLHKLNPARLGYLRERIDAHWHGDSASFTPLAGETFDLVTSLEVIEHVAAPDAFVAGLAAALAPSGLLILSTPNRTALSRLALITIGEGTGRIPRGTHDWEKFLTPDELTELLEAAGLRVVDTRGLSLSAARGFVMSDDMKLDYFVTAVKA